MGVKIHLHPDMSYLAGNSETVDTTGSTVGECLEQLISRYPGLRELIFYRDGGLQTFVEVYVNRRAACPNELECRVDEGDEIHLLMMIAGG